MIKIYHNPRCSKSRQGVAFLEESGKDFEIIKYLETPFTFDELAVVIDQLQIAPLSLIRKNEAIWKSDFKGNTHSDKELIKIMVAHPKLIERPIVIVNKKAVIGRPVTAIADLLETK